MPRLATTPAALTLALLAPLGASLLCPASASAAASADAIATPASAAAPAVSTGVLEARISRALARDARSRYLGGALSGTVVDLDSGRTIWATRATRSRMPASTQKVVTAFTALRSLGADHRLTTRTYQSAAKPSNVYVRGAGDPTLSSARLRSLAARTAADLRAQGRTRVNLYVDATLFPAPSLARGWKSSYVSDREVQWVRGLTTAGYRGPDGAAAAGRIVRAQFAASGITVAALGKAPTPAGRRLLEQSTSATVRAMIGRMLSVSSNDDAEYLLRLSALQAGLDPTWGNAIAHERRVLASNGIPLAGYVVADGSGLSRADRMPSATLVATLRKLYGREGDRQVVFAWGAMPRAAQTGTLAGRYRSGVQACAAGRVIAKTGTLGDVVALAGLARGVDGRLRVFALVENGVKQSTATRNAIDTLAADATACRS